MAPTLALILTAHLLANSCNPPEPVSLADITQATGAAPKPDDTLIVARVESEDANPELRTFVKSEGRWLSYDVFQADQEIIATKSTRDGRRMIWAWHTSEGPGQSFDGLLYGADGSLVCTRVDFSSVTNQPVWAMEYLSLDDVNIDRRGHGVLVASGDVAIAGKDTHVTYAFRTRDGGRTWGAPRRIKTPYHPAGIYH